MASTEETKINPSSRVFMNNEDISVFLSDELISPVKFHGIKKPKLQRTLRADPKSSFIRHNGRATDLSNLDKLITNTTNLINNRGGTNL